MPKATAREAIIDIISGDYEEEFFATRRDKRRNCIFCGKNIPPEETYYKNFEYPYMPDQKRWFTCKNCFDKVGDRFNELVEDLEKVKTCEVVRLEEDTYHEEALKRARNIVKKAFEIPDTAIATGALDSKAFAILVAAVYLRLTTHHHGGRR